MAPTATILFVNGVDIMNNSMTEAIDKDFAPIVTTSYGNCEAAWGSTEMNALNQLFKQANAQGQTMLSAAGDAGAPDCDTGPLAEEGVAVDFPGSSPYVTSMGGTQFSDGNATGVTQYWNANSSSSTANAGSATGYIPESPGTIFRPSLRSQAEAADSATFSRSQPGSRGRVCPPLTARAMCPTCRWTRPTPTTPSCTASTSRLQTAPDSCTSGFRNAGTNLETAGGTSFDSQIFGGMLALIEQKSASRSAMPTPRSMR